MMIKKLASAALAAVFLVGCADMQENPKTTIGTLVGAGLGALAGSQIGGGKGQLAAVAVGTLAGAYFGGEIGKSLDRADRAYMQNNAQTSLESAPTGTTSTWRNPDSRNSGTFTPTRTYQAARGEPCREFETTVNAGGQQESTTGTACRQADGSWKLMN